MTEEKSPVVYEHEHQHCPGCGRQVSIFKDGREVWCYYCKPIVVRG